MSLVRRARRNVRLMTLVSALALWGLAPGAVSATETITFVERISVDGMVIDGCDEPILMQGSLNTVLHLTFNDSGAATLVATTNAAGISGVGLHSGATYRGVGATIQPTRASQWPVDSSIDLIVSTLVDRTRIVGTAGAATLDIRTVFHLTKLDNEPVVIFDKPWIICR